MEEQKGILFRIIGILVLLQFCRIMFKKQILIFVPSTPLSYALVSAFVIIAFIFLILMIAKKENVEIFTFPHKQKIIYALCTFLSLGLLFSTPMLAEDFSILTIVNMIYSSVIIPVYEEFIFRGLCWNMLKEKNFGEFKIFIITTILFSVWHLGYVDSLFINAFESKIVYVVFMKMVTGLCFGIVLGLTRYATKNNYSTILLHGVMNIFGR